MKRTGWILLLALPLAGAIPWLDDATLAAPADGFVEITPGAAGASASTHDGNVPANVVDGNLGTRWSGAGDGAWLKLDLGTAKTVAYVTIAWYRGSARRSRFDLQVSTDNATWTTVAAARESSGTSTAEEIFDFPDVAARWVRYLGHGNTDGSSGQWNSVTELSVFAPADTTPAPPTPTTAPTVTPPPLPTHTPTPTSAPAPVYVNLTPGASGVTASTSDDNLPANAVDRNLATRWSGNGDGAWLKLDLAAARTVGYVTVAWYAGNTRVSRFDLQVSSDNVNWTTVVAGARSNGTTTAAETFDFADVSARWVRYVGHGNNAAGKTSWNSVTEIAVFGLAGDLPPTPTPTPTPVVSPGPPTPTPTPGSGVVSLFDGRTLNGWIQVPANSWEVKGGAMASKGAGRGYIYTVGQYSHYRLMFSLRQVRGDHQPCILVFGTYPPPSRDALGAIQLQPPNGGHWDYRPGRNNSGGSLFTRPTRTSFSRNEWARVEVLVNAARGTARMAVAQPIGTRAIENLRFNDPTAGQRGPIAWQMHNGGIFDEFKDVTVEENPAIDDLITTR